MKKQERKIARATEVNRVTAANRKRFSLLGWLVLLGPMLIILVVVLFSESNPLLKEHASKGAVHEASNNNSRGRDAMKAGRYRDAIGYFISYLL